MGGPPNDPGDPLTESLVLLVGRRGGLDLLCDQAGQHGQEAHVPRWLSVGSVAWLMPYNMPY